MGVNHYVEVELKVENQKIKDENQFIDSLLKDDEKALLYELLIEYNEDEENVKIDDNNEKTGDKMITSTIPLNDNYGWIENLHSNYQNSASSTSSFVFCFDINYSKQISSLGFNFNYHHSTIDTSDNIVFPVISQVSNLLKVVIQPGDVIIKINDKKLIEIVNRSNLNKEDYNFNKKFIENINIQSSMLRILRFNYPLNLITTTVIQQFLKCDPVATFSILKNNVKKNTMSSSSNNIINNNTYNLQLDIIDTAAPIELKRLMYALPSDNISDDSEIIQNSNDVNTARPSTPSYEDNKIHQILKMSNSPCTSKRSAVLESSSSNKKLCKNVH